MATIVKKKIAPYTPSNMYFCGDCRSNHKLDYKCVSCYHCKRTCQCRRRAGINPGVIIPRVNSCGIGSSSMIINSRRAVGLEVELSEFGTWYAPERYRGNLPAIGGGTGPSYVIDHDGSVHPSRREAVIQPLSGDQGLIQGLNSLAEHVYINNCQVNETCGYHVHVDATDFYWSDIQKLMLLWLALESTDSLWKLAGRNPNNFCKTWKTWMKDYDLTYKNLIDADLPKFKAYIIYLLYNCNIQKYRDNLKSIKNTSLFKQQMHDYKKRTEAAMRYGDAPIGNKPKTATLYRELLNHKELKANRGWNRAVPSRYLCLNIHSWLFRGTVEYRLGNGTVDPTDIRMWPLFCLWLTEAVARTSLKHIKYLIQTKDPIKAILSNGGVICPGFTKANLYVMPDYLQAWVNNKLTTNKELA